MVTTAGYMIRLRSCSDTRFKGYILRHIFYIKGNIMINTNAKYIVDLIHDAVKMESAMVEGTLPGTKQYRPEFSQFFGSISQWNVESAQAINLCMKMLNRRRFGNRRIPFADWFFYNVVMPDLNRLPKV